MKNYQTNVIIGTQWGDEGKGKISDYLAQKADLVVRFQGGNNAGHSIAFNGQRFALNHLPSGVFNPQTTNVMAQGMVINPQALWNEIKALWAANINNFKLLISDRAHIIMPYHLDLDQAYEAIKSKINAKDQIGTTKKGIGPAYADKTSRIGIRIGDLISPQAFKARLQAILIIKNKQLAAFGLKPYELDKLLAEYSFYAKVLLPFVCDTAQFVDKAITSGKRTLFEGAQGTMLCLDNGNYPFVTSSSPTAAAIPLGGGIRPHYITSVTGIVKAYSTRVGGGHMVTELQADEQTKVEYIRQRGNEFGIVTKRPRRIGWLDIVVLKHAIRVSGISQFALTLLDVLSGINELKIATHYQLDGKTIDYIPSSHLDYERCKPIYTTLPGWNEDISTCKSLQQLPPAAQKFIKTIEKLTNVPITFISVGPDRQQTIVL